jgi:hypothetical protein
MRTDLIFVFGSNLAGRHGKGAALFALKERGAKYGQAFGMQGQSFAIPTKNERFRPLPLDEIEYYVRTFLDFARARPDLTFQLTPIGCGLAGFSPEQIAPMFKDHPENVLIPDEFGWILYPQEMYEREQ